MQPHFSCCQVEEKEEQTTMHSTGENACTCGAGELLPGTPTLQSQLLNSNAAAAAAAAAVAAAAAKTGEKKGIAATLQLI